MNYGATYSTDPGSFGEITAVFEVEEGWDGFRFHGYAFTNREIKSMAPGAISFWRKWKAPLLALCDINHEGPADAPLAEKVVA